MEKFDLEGWMHGLTALGSTAHTCSPQSYAVFYAFLAGTAVILVGSFFVWRRLFGPKPISV
jgi:hypothetical protein